MRKTSNKYGLFHPDYRVEDKKNVAKLAVQFGKDLDLRWDSINISPKAWAAVYRVHSTKKGEGDGYSTIVPLDVIFSYQRKYHPESMEITE